MPQFDFGVIQTATTTGSDLATILENWRDAVLSNHSGTTRPTYVKPGQIWVQMQSGTNWIVNLFDGVNDIPLGTVNPTNDTTSFSGRSLIQTNSGSAAITLSQNGMTLGISGTNNTNVILNLPAAAATGNGFRITVQKRDSTNATITLTSLAQDNINGSTTYVLQEQYQNVTLISDGGNSWYALGAGISNGSITTDKLANLAVTSAKLADASVSASKLNIGGIAGSVMLHDGTQWSGWSTSVAGAILRSQGAAGVAQWGNQVQRSSPFSLSAQAGSFTVSGFSSVIRRLSIVFSGVTMSSASTILVSIGSATGGIPTTGYVASGSRLSGATISGSSEVTTGFPIPVSTTLTDGTTGVLTLSRNDTLQTVATYTGRCGASSSVIGGGVVTLSDVMDRVNIRTVNAANTWTGGTVTFLWE